MYLLKENLLYLCALFANDMMKNVIWLAFFAALFASCNDGDITIERITFTGEQLYSCTQDTTTNFLYKTQDKQALILSFTNGLLTNKTDTITGEIPTRFKLYYRIFDNTPTNTYFCSVPPSSTPKVTSEIEAQGGQVQIITKEIRDTIAQTTKYNHLIQIKDLLITNGDGERIIESNFIFGTYQTTK